MGRFIKKKKLPDIHNEFLRLKYDNADCLTEGDVEHKIIIPILEKIFNIPNVNIKAKNYVPSFNIGKGSKFQSGYFPDFTVFVNTLPVVVVEAKSPDKPIELAIEEAKLYALELNKKYKSGVNPAKYIIASNGVQFAFGIAYIQNIFAIISEITSFKLLLHWLMIFTVFSSNGRL